jgi:hypothetical protein
LSDKYPAKISPILWVIFLLCRSFLIWCDPICQSLLLFPDRLESYSESSCLCLDF